MSTYTDYKCERKENLTILRKPGCPEYDGLTPQKVIFANEANIFKGTFEGKVIAKDMALSGVEINDCTIRGGLLDDVTIQAGGTTVQLNDLTAQISQHGTDIENLSSEIDKLRLSAENNLSILGDISSDIVEYTNAQLSNLSVELTGQIDAVSTDIVSCIQTVSSNITSNINAISTYLSIEISNEIDNRKLNDSFISGKVDDLSSNFVKHVEHSNDRFDFEHAFTLSSIAHDEHYQIVTDLTSLKPYKLHDFAVNVIEDGIDTAKLMFEEKQIGVAQITSGGKLKLQTSGTRAIPQLSSILPDPYNQELRDSIATPIKNGSKFYSVTWTSADNNVKFETDAKNYIAVYDPLSNFIGYVKDFALSSNTVPLTILSGVLDLVPVPFESQVYGFLESFDNIPFTQDSRETPISNECRITLDPSNSGFLFDKGVKIRQCVAVKTEDNTFVGYVFADRFLSTETDGIISCVFDNIVVPAYGNCGSVTLNKDNDFCGYTSENNLIVSCDFIGDNAFDILSASTYYKYKFKSNDGYIVPTGVNAKLEDKPDTISTYIEVQFGDATIGETYELYRDDSASELKYSYVSDNVKIEYANGKITADGKIGSFSFEAKNPFEIDVNNPIMEFVESTLKSLVKSNAIAFDFIDSATTYSERIPVVLGNEIQSIGASVYTLDIENLSTEDQIVTYQIPNKDTKYHDCSREFIIASNIKALDEYVKIEFKNSDGHLITVVSDNFEEILLQPASKDVIMQLKEIEQNKFLLTHLTHNDFTVNNLSANSSIIQNLSISTENIIDSTIEHLTATNVNAISANIDNAEVSTITIVSKATIECISANTADIAYLSTYDLSVNSENVIDSSIENLTASNIIAISANINDADFSKISVSSEICAEYINANDVEISSVSAQNLTIGSGEVIDSKIENLTATNGSAIYSSIDTAIISNISANNISNDFAHLFNLNEKTGSKYKTLNTFIESVDLSIDNLCAYVSSEICNGICVDVYLSSQISANNVEIADLWKNVRGGLNYAGNLCIDILTASESAFDMSTISGLIADNIYRKSGKSTPDVLSIKLREGFFFVLEASSKTYRRILDGHELEHGDWLIINSNHELSALSSSDVNIFDAQDYDSFRLSSDNFINGTNIFNGALNINAETTFDGSTTINTTLSSNAIYVSTDVSASKFIASDLIFGEQLSGETLDVNRINADSISNNIANITLADITKAEISVIDITLSAKSECISANTAEIIDLNVNKLNATDETVSSAIIDKLTSINTEISIAAITKATVENLSIDLEKLVNTNDKTSFKYSNANQFIQSVELSIDTIDKMLDDELSNNVRYFGSLTSDNTALTTMLHDNLSHNDAYKFNIGDQYRMSTSCELSDNSAITKYLGINDYIIFNSTCILSSVIWENIDIIRDASIEGTRLSATVDEISGKLLALSGKLNETSTILSAKCDDISSAVSVNIDNISKLSTELSSLSTETYDMVGHLSSCTDYLSSELSDYHNTLSGIDRNLHTIGHIASDNLMITDISANDDGKHNRYYLTMINGNLIFKRI